MLCIVLGAHFSIFYLMAIGYGIAAYGLCYFLVHDMFDTKYIGLFWSYTCDSPFFVKF